MALSTIAGGAIIALELCEKREVSPPIELVALFRKLLKLDKIKAGTSRSVQAKQFAILLVSQHPDISPSELAQQVQVNKSTASRWLKDPEFREAAAILPKLQVLELNGIVDRSLYLALV
jgi:hypothetical protein